MFVKKICFTRALEKERLFKINKIEKRMCIYDFIGYLKYCKFFIHT